MAAASGAMLRGVRLPSRCAGAPSAFADSPTIGMILHASGPFGCDALAMHEIELKFAVPSGNRSALEKALKQGRVHSVRMQAAYFDTADDRLGKHGALIRLRKEGRRWVQTAKAVTADSIRRIEHNVVVKAASGSGRPVLDLALHNGTSAGAALRKALGRRRAGDANAALLVRFRTDVTRTTRTVRIAGALVELALDIGKIAANDRSIDVSELEFELKSGNVGALVSLAGRWADRHGLWLSTVSKAERGARLARGETGGHPVKAVPLIVEGKCGSAAFLRAAVQSCLAQVLANASEVGASATDDEVIHQLRVGLRRLRTALRELASPGSGIDPAWEPMLRSAFRELGVHRDLAIVVPSMRAEIAAAGAPSFADPKAEHRPHQPQAVVRDPAFQRTLLALLAFCHESPALPDGGDSNGRHVRALIARRLDRLGADLRRDAKRFARLDPALQHRVRKRLKRLRYLSEFAAPLFGNGQVKRYLEKWQQAQDALGEHNDQRISAEIFRAEAAKEPHAWFAVGWLAARGREGIKRCERALRAAASATAFWTV